MATWPFGQKPRVEFRRPDAQEAVPLLLRGCEVETILSALKLSLVSFGHRWSEDERLTATELILNIEHQSRMREL